MRNLSAFILPALVLYVIIYGMFKGIDIFSEFLEGIKESIKISIKILPNIAGIMIAIAMLRESGLLEMIISFFNPVFKFFINFDKVVAKPC